MTHSCLILRHPLPNQELIWKACGRSHHNADRQMRVGWWWWWSEMREAAAVKPRDDTTTHSPDEQQDEAVQTPLQGAEAHALDAHQLVGLVLAQSSRAAARHGRLRANSEGRGWCPSGGREGRGTSDSFLHSSPSCVDGHMSRLLQLLSTFHAHPRTPTGTCDEVSMHPLIARGFKLN